MSNEVEETTVTALQLTERPKALRERLKAIMDKPGIVELICEHVANGGSLIDLCSMWAVSYGKVVTWIYANPESKRLYQEAFQHRNEWADEMILSGLRTYAQADVRQLVDKSGKVLSLQDLPDAIAQSVQSIDIIIDIEGNVTHKIKLVPKVQARQLLGKNRGLFVDKIEHSGIVKLDELIGGSMTDPNDPLNKPRG